MAVSRSVRGERTNYGLRRDAGLVLLFGGAFCTFMAMKDTIYSGGIVGRGSCLEPGWHFSLRYVHTVWAFAALLLASAGLSLRVGTRKSATDRMGE
jgi:hypothetical protein